MNTAAATTSVASTTLPFANGMPAAQGRSGASLARHVQHCAQARGRWFTLQCAADSVHAAVSPRFFTSILVSAGLIGLLVEWM